MSISRRLDTLKEEIESLMTMAKFMPDDDAFLQARCDKVNAEIDLIKRRIENDG
jgi:hypothetical protein